MFEPTTPAAPSPVLGGVAASSVDDQQSNATSPDSSIPHGQGTLTDPTSSTYLTSQDNHTSPQEPQASTIRQPRQVSPIRTQINPSAQHIIPAPAAIVPSTPKHSIPKSANGEGVKNSRKQGTASTSSAPDGRLCF